MRVLVVEDEPDLGDVFRDFLLELGHQPLILRSAEAALSKLHTERPDAIILDIHLPGMSGLDFLQLRPVRELGVPIIAVSGVATESQARECLRLGAADFVGKPVTLDRLDEVLTFVEPHALSRFAEGRAPAERRQSSRLPLALPIRVIEYGGTEHYGTTVELGVQGLKARLNTSILARSVVKLSFTPPDAGSSITVMSLLIRADTDGHAFTFVHLPDADTARLRELIQHAASR
jgi:CheY-like chemotaxis protein